MLVVIVVFIGLAFGMFFAVGNKMAKTRDARRKSDLDRIKIALYDYYFDNDCFPTDLPDCDQGFGFEGQYYLPRFPCDMLGNIYTYETDESDCPSWFKVLTNLEISDDESIVASGCGRGCGSECQFNYGVASTNTKLNDGCVTYYACSPNGECTSFYDPQKSQCPRVFENDEVCGGIDCSKDKNVKCHDMSGKFHD